MLSAARARTRLAARAAWGAGVLLSLLGAACPRATGGVDGPSGGGCGATRAPLGDAASYEAASSAAGAPSRLAADAGRDGGTLERRLGTARHVDKGLCRALAGGGPYRVAERDLGTSFVDGDDWLALVNRSPTGGLPPDYIPKDLVNLRSLEAIRDPKACDAEQCLRREAATALRAMMAEMTARGFPGKVESAYRSYGNQCGTFQHWAKDGTFCAATEQSALPGHSQHQLGTTVDLFTEQWAKDVRGVFREGFGCTPAGKWLREHSWEHGFVMPYPIHPDDEHPRQRCLARADIPVGINPRTGYRFEHWHFRYVGKAPAAEFFEDYGNSDAASPRALTLEQWLRRRRGLVDGDVDLPVCDGCNCGECSTLASGDETPCKDAALLLGEDGQVLAASGAPALLDTRRVGKSASGYPIVRVRVRLPAGVVTQTPVTQKAGALYGEGGTFESVSPYPGSLVRPFPTIGEAFRIGVEPSGAPPAGRAWPWRAALSDPEHARVYDRANLLLPAPVGEHQFDVEVPTLGEAARVTLLRGDAPTEVREIDLR